jgi:hypothetical protein
MNFIESNQAAEETNNEIKTSLFQTEVKTYPPSWNFSMGIATSCYQKPVEIPSEDLGQGTNRHVYFVTSDLTGDWIQLPNVSPHQINVSRRIKKYLTGDLNAKFSSHPKFPGTEMNYLRALIARISASTTIEPQNFESHRFSTSILSTVNGLKF